MTIREDECRYDEEPIFFREWKGTERGCEMHSSWGKDPRVLDFETWKRKERCTESYDEYGNSNNNCRPDQARCFDTAVHPGVNMTEFYDLAFCGVRGGNSFLSILRPDL